MNNETTFRRTAAISAIIAALLILASSVVLFMAVDFNFEVTENPAGLITAGLDAGAARLFRWGSILEMLGYFLLLIPATLYLWEWLKPQNPNLVTLYTICGLISIVIGLIGAALRASFFPSMMIAYPQAAEAQRQVLQITFESVTNFTFDGLYALDSILAGVWWLGIGLFLRTEKRALGLVTAIMGVAILGAGFGWLLQIDPLARLEAFYFLEPIWLLWLGIVILQDVKRSEPVTKHAMAT